jgi:hypothetical protein
MEGQVEVRYSKDHGGLFFVFIAHEREALTARVRNEEFELAGRRPMGEVTR